MSDLLRETLDPLQCARARLSLCSEASDALKREVAALLDLCIAAVDTVMAENLVKERLLAVKRAQEALAGAEVEAEKAARTLAVTKRLCAKESMLAQDAAERLGDVNGAFRAGLEKGP